METTTHALEKEITILTELIRNKYPEIYRNMNEMPITIPKDVSAEIKTKQLNDYLESLKTLIKTHEV